MNTITKRNKHQDNPMYTLYVAPAVQLEAPAPETGVILKLSPFLSHFLRNPHSSNIVSREKCCTSLTGSQHPFFFVEGGDSISVGYNTQCRT